MDGARVLGSTGNSNSDILLGFSEIACHRKRTYVLKHPTRVKTYSSVGLFVPAATATRIEHRAACGAAILKLCVESWYPTELAESS